MSDNPADSLRRELEAAVVATQRRLGTTDMTWQLTRDELVPDLLPIVTAALEAARADERERAIAAIKASPFWDKHIEDGLQQMGYAQALNQVVQLLRSEPSVLAYQVAVSDGN